MTTRRSIVEWTLRGRVVASLAALGIGAAWIGDDANARVAAAMLAAPLLVDFVMKQRRLHQTEIRIAARRTTAGASFAEHLLLVHQGPRRLRECLLVESRTMRADDAVLLPGLAPGVPLSAGFRARSLQRSRVHERVFVLLSAWPLGLFKSRAVLPVAAELVTEPARVPLQADVVRAVAEQEQARAERLSLPGPDFHSLRELMPEEDARGVHALRSAAMATLVRRINQGRAPRDVGVVLDLRRPPGRPLHQGTRHFEWSLGACAALLDLLRARAAQVHLLVLDAEPRRFLVQPSAAATDVLTFLAEARPTPHQALGASVFDEVRRLEHCFWVPAGAWLAAAESALLPASITVLRGDFE
jgi:hypothetical protein